MPANEMTFMFPEHTVPRASMLARIMNFAITVSPSIHAGQNNNVHVAYGSLSIHVGHFSRVRVVSACNFPKQSR